MVIDTESPTGSCPPHADTPAKRFGWWRHLEPQWRAAFQFAFLGHTNPPDDEELERLWQTPALRFAGPKAPYPNLNVELTNCSGLVGMHNLETLVLTNHALETIGEVADLINLKSLFVNNNNLGSLNGIESLGKLEQLYAQVNRIDSLEPLRNLTNLREVYVSFNALTALDGVTRKHVRAMKTFFCLPNEHLTEREITRVERNLGIKCRSI